jgi:hypothetical protein
MLPIYEMDILIERLPYFTIAGAPRLVSMVFS